MTIKELYEKISDQQFTMNRGIANSVNHAAFYEQMKNVLLNNLDAIVDALKFATNAEQQINVLNVELNDAERELTEMDARIKELEEQVKTTGKKQKAPARNE